MVDFKKIMEDRDKPETKKKHNLWLATSLTRDAHFDVQSEYKLFGAADNVHEALRCLSEIPESGVNLGDWSYLTDRSQELTSLNIVKALKVVKDTLRKYEV